MRGKDLCERLGENDAVLGQSVYIRCVRVGVAVAAQGGPQVVDDDQQDVRTRGRGNDGVA